MRNTTMRVAAVAAVVGAAAFGDHHGGGPIVAPPEDCSQYPLGCQGQCYELNACRAGNTPIGGSDCGIEDANLQACKINPPPFVPPVIIVTPPPACPAGQHLNEGGECQADHECGADEIGGGDEDCEACPDGEVPNEDGTECATCQFGESDTVGRCNPDPCNRAGVDDYVVALRFQRQPFETGSALFCRNHTVGGVWERSSANNVCRVDFEPVYSESCWRGGSRTTGCTLASAHTHPYFTKADEGKMCHGRPITKTRAIDLNNDGMDFSSFDKEADRASGVEGYLGVSDASCVRAHRIFGWTQTIAGECSDVPLEPEPW